MVNVGSIGRLHLVLAAPVGVTCSHFRYTPAHMRISLFMWCEHVASLRFEFWRDSWLLYLCLCFRVGCYTVYLCWCFRLLPLRVYSAPRDVDGDPIPFLPGAASLALGVLWSGNQSPPSGSGAGPSTMPGLRGASGGLPGLVPPAVQGTASGTASLKSLWVR